MAPSAGIIEVDFTLSNLPQTLSDVEVCNSLTMCIIMSSVGKRIEDVQGSIVNPDFGQIKGVSSAGSVMCSSLS